MSGLKRKRKNLFILFLGTLLIFGCAKEEKSKTTGPQVIPVKVIKVQLKDLQETLDYVGNIKAQDEATVYPKVSGKIIEKVKEDGTSIAKGEVIAYIDRDEVGLKYEKAPVESPISGVIGRVYVDKGTNVTALTTPIALVINMQQMKINLDIPEKYLPSIFLDQQARVSVDAYPEEEFIGKVTKVSPVVNLENRAAPVQITIDNQQQRLKSGMFAKVSLNIKEHKNVPTILKEAIMGKDPDTYVYTIVDNKALLKPITLGVRKAEYFEVKEGLKEGDLVVIMGQQRLYDNAPVAVEINNQNN